MEQGLGVPVHQSPLLTFASTIPLGIRPTSFARFQKQRENVARRCVDGQTRDFPVRQEKINSSNGLVTIISSQLEPQIPKPPTLHNCSSPKNPKKPESPISIIKDSEDSLLQKGNTISVQLKEYMGSKQRVEAMKCVDNLESKSYSFLKVIVNEAAPNGHICHSSLPSRAMDNHNSQTGYAGLTTSSSSAQSANEHRSQDLETHGPKERLVAFTFNKTQTILTDQKAPNARTGNDAKPKSGSSGHEVIEIDDDDDKKDEVPKVVADTNHSSSFKTIAVSFIAAPPPSGEAKCAWDQCSGSHPILPPACDTAAGVIQQQSLSSSPARDDVMNVKGVPSEDAGCQPPSKRRFAFTTGSRLPPPKRRREQRGMSDGLQTLTMLAATDEFELCPATKVGVQTCFICGVPEDSHCTLLCDSCSSAFHTYCLNPPMESTVPDGDWQCPTCLKVKAPIFVRDPYIFFYPEICYSGGANVCNVSLMYKTMRWLLRYRSASRWDLLTPFVFHHKDQPDLVTTLTAHLSSARRKFSACDQVALLLEYAPYEEGAWGHKMLVIFDKENNDVKYYDSLGATAFSSNPDHIFAVSAHMARHFAAALQSPSVQSSIGMSAQEVTNVLKGHLQHRCEYVCQSWMLLIFDALISRTCTADDFRRLSELPGITYEPRCIPGTQLKESVVFRSAAQLMVLFHTFHLRRLLGLRKEGAPKGPFGLPWGMLTRATFPELMGATRKSINRSYARELPWVGKKPFLNDTCEDVYDPLHALRQFLATGQGHSPPTTRTDM
eukprot:GGOE01019640.1.p1 GENE.GGOE01019640.1~~GGOE01019640.1.p1  ORF type:complete len:777 (+),score=105.98 GGOE01019640.1:30-2360(+)